VEQIAVDEEEDEEKETGDEYRCMMSNESDDTGP
jgi:hypothetical protein